MSGADRIELRGIRVFARHGANPGERDVPQPFDIDVSAEIDLAAARRSDALADTLDYDALHRRIVALTSGSSYALLERLGDAILATILADDRIAGASVTIAKPRLLAGATPVVTVHGTRADRDRR
ncbi:MAG: dihydroneopterin aldolase [Candidatus Velthaea sp.]